MADVSRETTPAPAAPESARRVFAQDRLAVAIRFADLLAGPGVVRGLLGPRETPRLWDRHLLNCAVLGELIEPESRVADLGSGAGLPGLVLAIARPDLHVTLVEPLLRRATFLTETVAELELDRVRVLRSRAEELHGSERFDVVTARALAPLGRLLGWAMPLVESSGSLIAMKGAKAPEEIEAVRPTSRRAGIRDPELRTVGTSLIDPPTTVVRVTWDGDARVSWPLAERPASASPTTRPQQARKRRRQRG